MTSLKNDSSLESNQKVKIKRNWFGFKIKPKGETSKSSTNKRNKVKKEYSKKGKNEVTTIKSKEEVETNNTLSTNESPVPVQQHSREETSVDETKLNTSKFDVRNQGKGLKI